MLSVARTPREQFGTTSRALKFKWENRHYVSGTFASVRGMSRTRSPEEEEENKGIH